MQSRWSDADAAACLDRYRSAGEDLALRVYTSRLIGADPQLVLHGGGNTSVKTSVTSLLGAATEVLCIKGSGWNLATIEPAGLPAVELEPLRGLRPLVSLADADMVNEVRRRLLHVEAPTPSVEVLLHAFLPHKFVDHTHANAVLELTNQPDAEALVREAMGERVALLPWIMPGFPLAKAVADAYEAMPDCEGLVLLRHGVFTFGDDARSSYERMIELVDRAERFVEQRIAGRPLATTVPATAPAAVPALADVAPVVRGAVAQSDRGPLGESWRRAIMAVSATPELVALSGHPQCAALLGRGPLTPDHSTKTKGWYLHLARAVATVPEQCRSAVQAYADDYRAYYEANQHRVAGEPAMLDPAPRVVFVEGLGALAFGADKRAAMVALDIATHTAASVARAEALGEYSPLPRAEQFEVEYWSQQLAKLGPAVSAPPLCGQVALVTGAAGAIGCGIAESLLGAGAHVVLADVDQARLATAAARLAERFRPERVATAIADITDADGVAAMFAKCCAEFGGVDVLVPNAGVAHVSKLADMDPARFARVVEINLTGTMLVLREAARVFAAQGTGGAVVVQASKNVFDPGAGFGAYSASKAGAHQLGKIAALELAPLGVSVNMVNADAVFGDDEIPSGLWEAVGPDRMRARGLDPQGLRDFYRNRSLLKRQVLPAHVGEAVVFFAAGATRTTGATLPVDAGIPGAFPR
ncbi:MAG: bifunctional aldolase/short-chain dehydrogenase [Planctomycetota bacterium]